MNGNSINDCNILELVISVSGGYFYDMAQARKNLHKLMIDSEHVVRPITE
jgi:hypothetical protein